MFLFICQTSARNSCYSNNVIIKAFYNSNGCRACLLFSIIILYWRIKEVFLKGDARHLASWKDDKGIIFYDLKYLTMKKFKTLTVYNYDIGFGSTWILPCTDDGKVRILLYAIFILYYRERSWQKTRTCLDRGCVRSFH